MRSHGSKSRTPSEHQGLIGFKGKTKPDYFKLCLVYAGQHQWYHVGVGAPPILEPILVGIGMFTGGTGILTHGHVFRSVPSSSHGCSLARTGDRFGERTFVDLMEEPFGFQHQGPATKRQASCKTRRQKILVTNSRLQSPVFLLFDCDLQPGIYTYIYIHTRADLFPGQTRSKVQRKRLAKPREKEHGPVPSHEAPQLQEAKLDVAAFVGELRFYNANFQGCPVRGPSMTSRGAWYCASEAGGMEPMSREPGSA